MNLSAVSINPNEIVNLGANNQQVPHLGGSYLRVSSDSSVLNSRVFTLAAGTDIGQTLYLELVGANLAKLAGTEKHLKAGDILFLIWNGTEWRFVSEVSALFQKNKPDFVLFEDFMGQNSTDLLNSTQAGTGAGFANIIPPTLALRENRVGFRQFTTGTTATGRASLLSPSTTLFVFDDTPIFYEEDIYIPVLPTVAEAFILPIGFMDNFTETSIADGAYFRYSQAAATVFAVTKNNSLTTAVDTGFTVLANTWVRLKIEVTSASALFYINDSLVATITTNIPTAVGRETAFGCSLLKTAGTTARIAVVDYIRVFKELKR